MEGGAFSGASATFADAMRSMGLHRAPNPGLVPPALFHGECIVTQYSLRVQVFGASQCAKRVSTSVFFSFAQQQLFLRARGLYPLLRACVWIFLRITVGGRSIVASLVQVLFLFFVSSCFV